MTISSTRPSEGGEAGTQVVGFILTIRTAARVGFSQARDSCWHPAAGHARIGAHSSLKPLPGAWPGSLPALSREGGLLPGRVAGHSP